MKLAWLPLVCTACAAPPPPRRAPEPAPPAPPALQQTAAIDALDYQVHLDLDPAQHSFTARAAIRFRVVESGKAAVFDAEGLVVDAVEAAGRPLPFRHLAKQLRVQPPKALLAGESRQITVRYHGASSPGLTIDEGTAFTAFHTSQWLPCRFNPQDKATFSIELGLPDGWRAARSSSRRPYSAYVFGFVAGPFRQVLSQRGGVTLELLGQRDADDLRRVFAATPPAMAFFEERAGLPYPEPRYTQALVPIGSGQELASLSLLSTGYADTVLKDETEDWLVVHELAHQWWGNWATCAGWKHFWLNEALATFMTAAYKERRWGRAAYDREVTLAQKRYQKLRSEGRDRALVPEREPTDSASVGGPLPYTKGMLVLALLRARLGDAPFFAALRQFTRQHAGATFTTDDFRRALEETSRQPLASFFRDFVFGTKPLPGLPG